MAFLFKYWADTANKVGMANPLMSLIVPMLRIFLSYLKVKRSVCYGLWDSNA
jgi:hypothetical protein